VKRNASIQPVAGYVGKPQIIEKIFPAALYAINGLLHSNSQVQKQLSGIAR
jgi:hypothetical protein